MVRKSDNEPSSHYTGVRAYGVSKSWIPYAGRYSRTASKRARYPAGATLVDRAVVRGICGLVGRAEGTRGEVLFCVAVPSHALIRRDAPAELIKDDESQ